MITICSKNILVPCLLWVDVMKTYGGRIGQASHILHPLFDMEMNGQFQREL